MTTIGEQVAGGGDQARENRRIWAAIEALQNARGLEHSSIGSNGLRFHSGGSIVVDDNGDIIIRGGDLRLVDENGESIAIFGELGDGRTGIRFAYDTGAPLFTRQGVPGQQFWGFWDSQGNIVVSNDAESGTGLARPYLNYLLVPTDTADPGPTYLWPSTTSATPVALLGGVNPVWHPKMTIAVKPLTDGGGTGHWRLKINSTIVIEDETAFGIHEVDIPTWGDEGGINPGDRVAILVEAWATDGATRVYVQNDRCFGRQS